MTSRELRTLWERIKTFFALKGDLTNVSTQVNSINSRLNEIYPTGASTISANKLPSYIDDVITGKL